MDLDYSKIKIKNIKNRNYLISVEFPEVLKDIYYKENVKEIIFK